MPLPVRLVVYGCLEPRDQRRAADRKNHKKRVASAPMHEQILRSLIERAAPRLTMDELEDLLAQHASVTMNLGLKDHSVSRRDALLGQSLAAKR